MKTIYYAMVLVILIAGLTAGCIEPSKEYTTIWCGGTMSVCAYSPNNVFLGCEATQFSEEQPYTDYDWNEEMSIEEMFDTLGIPYNRIDTEYEKIEHPASDKIVMNGRYTVYTDAGHFKLTLYYTATRY